MSQIWKPKPIAVYIQWVVDIAEESSEKLSDWENTFIESVYTRLEYGTQLTEAQAKKLEELYVKYTS